MSKHTVAPEDAATGLHRLLLELSGHLPVDLLVHVRGLLATPDAASAAAAADCLVAALSGLRPLLGRADVVLLAAALDGGSPGSASGALAGLGQLPVLGEDRLGGDPATGRPALPLRVDPRAQPLPDDVVRAVTGHAGARGLWAAQAGGEPGGWPPRTPVFVVALGGEADDPHAPARLAADLAAVAARAGEGPVRVEVVPAEVAWPPLATAVLGVGQLAWQREPDGAPKAEGAGPALRAARIHDGPDPATGGACFAPDRPRPEGAEREAMLAALDAGVPLGVTAAVGDDVLAAGAASGTATATGTGVGSASGTAPGVPLGLRTDGVWVWSDAVAAYLRRHGIGPQPELAAHLLAVPCPTPLDAVAWARAREAVLALGGDPVLALDVPVSPVPAWAAASPSPAALAVLAASTITPAGRFLTPPPASGAAPVPLAAPARVHVVHADLVDCGARVAGVVVPTAVLAEAIGACPGRRGRPVVVATVRPLDDPARVVLAELSRGVGVPVGACPWGGVQVGPGCLHAPAPLEWWLPSEVAAERVAEVVAEVAAERVAEVVAEVAAARVADGAAALAPDRPLPLEPPVPDPPHRRVAAARPVLPGPTPTPTPASSWERSGPLLPAVLQVAPPTALPDDDPVLPAPPAPAVVPVALAPATPTPVTPAPAAHAARSTLAAVARGGTAATPTRPSGAREWVAVGAASAADRAALREVLGRDYDLHARTVGRALSLSPGLRTGVAADELLPGLISARAYLTSPHLVDAVLRGRTPSPDDVHRARLLARCAAAGLRRLPAVHGPVFCLTKPPAGGLKAYAEGDVLAEPSFTRVTTRPASGPGLLWAIWSRSARRSELLEVPGASAPAVFAPGTRFRVLAVEPAQPGEPGVGVPADRPPGPGRILLVEEGVDPAPDAVERLRAALTPEAPRPDPRAATRLTASAGTRRTGSAQAAEPLDLGAPAAPPPIGLDADGLPFAAEPAPQTLEETPCAAP